MVKSGLVDNPNVSHYRLAIHLSTALLLFTAISWVALGVAQKREKFFPFLLNAAKDIFGNMYTYGIVDPAKVTRSGLQNATSIASMILTTECIIVDDNKVSNE